MGETGQRDTIARRMRQAREAAGLSQGQVAKMLDMHRPTVSEIEAGRRRVAAEELASFARVYGTTVEWLVGKERLSATEREQKIELAARQLGAMRDKDLDKLMHALRMLRGSRGSSK